MLLDIGCGTGTMMRVFVKRGWTMLGSDISFQMRSAQVNALRNNVQVFQTDGVSIPLANQSVDVIWVSGVLKYNLFPAPAGAAFTGVLVQLGEVTRRPPKRCRRI